MNKVTIGNADLYLGDCRDILPTLKADAVVTDPPYLDGDLSEVLPMLLTASERVVVTPGKLEAFNWIRRKAPDWEYAWSNASKSLGGAYCLHICWEPILVYGKPRRPLGADLLSFPIRSAADKPNHPWPKPLELMKKLVSHWSNEDQTVLDPYCGSGTTGIACVQSNRKFVGIEIHEPYFDIACERIENAQRQERLFA